MSALRYWSLPLISLAGLCGGTAAYGETSPSCFAKDTLDLVRAVVTYRGDYLDLPAHKDDDGAVKDGALGFTDITTSERTTGNVHCTLTTIDKKTRNVLSHLNYDVVRTADKPYVWVHFDAGSNPQYRCTPLFSRALIIPSEVTCR